MSLSQIINILLSRKKIMIIVFSTIMLLSIAFSLLSEKKYTATASIAIDMIKADPITNMPLSGQLAVNYLSTQINVLTSHNTAKKVVEMTGLNTIPEAKQKFAEANGGAGDINDWLADSILNDVKAQLSKDSSIIDVTYTSNDPAFAAVMANAFIDAYKKTMIEIRSNLAMQNNSFFQQQLQLLQKKLEEKQKILSVYQQTEGIVATDERIDVENQRLNDISAQLVATQGMLIDAESRLKKDGDIAPDVLNNPLIQQLQSQIAALDAKFRQIASKEGPNHPAYQQSLAELSSLKSQLNKQISQYSDSLSVTAKNLKQRLEGLKSAVEAQKARVLELKSQRSKLDLLQRDVDNAQQIYQIAMQKLSESSLESSSDITNISTLREATIPTAASKPLILLNLILGFFVGIIMSIFAGLIRELTDRRIRSSSDIENIFGIPVLSVVSNKNKSKK